MMMLKFQNHQLKQKLTLKVKITYNGKKKKIRKPYKKPITKQNLQDALDFAFNDGETVDYNNDTRIDVLDTLKLLIITMILQ